MHIDGYKTTYRVNPLEMTSVSCTSRRAFRDSPVRVLLLWISVWSCVARAWTALCMRPCLHSMTPLSPTQPSSARPHGAAASDHRPSDAEQRPSSTAARPTSPAMSLRKESRREFDNYKLQPLTVHSAVWILVGLKGQSTLFFIFHKDNKVKNLIINGMD